MNLDRQHTLSLTYNVSKKLLPIYVVTHYIKWVTTSWTHSIDDLMLQASKSSENGLSHSTEKKREESPISPEKSKVGIGLLGLH